MSDVASLLYSTTQTKKKFVHLKILLYGYYLFLYRHKATKQRPAVTRKERRFQWTQENMNTACAAVSSGTMSQRNAAKHYEFLGQPCRKY